jgi:hypothetical protein
LIKNKINYALNREKFLAQQKEYYLSAKTQEMLKQPYLCPICNVTIMARSRYDHNRSQKHKDALASVT